MERIRLSEPRPKRTRTKPLTREEAVAEARRRGGNCEVVFESRLKSSARKRVRPGDLLVQHDFNKFLVLRFSGG